MRVLVTTVPGTGHVDPLLPMARRLRAQGDEVVWATGLDQCKQLASEPFEAIEVCPPLSQWMQQLASRTRGRPFDGVPPQRLPHWAVPRLFGEVGLPFMLDGLLAYARAHKPDVVLFDSRCYAGPLVARAVGALPVLQAVTTLLAPDVETLLNDAVAPAWAEQGLETPTYGGVFDGVTFSAFPESLDPSSYPDVTVHRLAPAHGAPLAPPWLAEWRAKLGDRPLVYATLGTVFGTPKVLRAFAEGLGGEDYAVLLTLGFAGDPAALGELPPNVRAERFVPQHAVLPHCAAVVSHGGSGTTLAAIAHDLPHVLVPQGADQFINAQRCQAAGLGRAVLPAAVSAESVRAACRDVLASTSYREKARVVGAEMRGGLGTDAAIGLVRQTREAQSSRRPHLGQDEGTSRATPSRQ